MKHRRMNKYERADFRQEKLKADMGGSGLFIYQNNTDGDLSLPKPTASGQRKIGPRGKFQGDSYFRQWVGPPLNLLRFVGEVVPVHEEVQSQKVITEAKNMEKKLLLDQPDMVTAQGKVEHVVANPKTQLKRLDDAADPQAGVPQETLLTEDPLDGVEIILN